MQALTDDAVTVASELVANAIAAVPPGTPGLSVIFAIHARPPQLSIYTWDIGPGQPRRHTAGDDAETGRGLAIIDHLTSSQWGWWPTPASGGKVVHATLTTPSPARPGRGPAGHPITGDEPARQQRGAVHQDGTRKEDNP